MNRLVAIGAWFVAAVAAGGAHADEVTATAYLSHDRLAPGQPFRVAVVVEIAKPWHVNANPASLPELIPTRLTFAETPGIEWGAVTYPPGKPAVVVWASKPVALYDGRITLHVAGRVTPDAAVGPRELTGTLTYQACDDNVCLAPQRLPLVLRTEIRSQPPQPIHPELFPPATPATAPPPAASDNHIARTIAERGWLVAGVVIFLGGLALNLTPCVYPMIAITVSYFGGTTGRSRGQAFVSALIYCAGIVVTYTLLGVVAALTGGLFGALLQSPAVLVGVALLLVALALSMFGLYELRPPQWLVQRAGDLSARGGQIGVFLLGATLGIIAAPCLAPFVVALLAYVGTSRQWWWFAVFAVGLALPYVVLGTFSGLLSRLPRSGAWMEKVKRIFGVLLLAVAVWFVWPVIGPKARPSPIAWEPYSAGILTHPGKPVLLDFYADWCIPCHEMDKRTFTDPRVVEAAKQFRMVKVDLTRSGSPEVEQLMRDYRIAGVPTFAFFDAAGRELTQLRQVGFVPADRFLNVMRTALTSTAPTNPPAASDPAREIPPQLLRGF
jgi:thiol:disulfide interchange protein DsbD